MHREGRGMTTTAEGHRLATALTEAFDQIASASADLMRQTAARALRVAVTPSFAANWLMPRIGHFWETHPEIELEIIPSMALVDLRRDNIDVAIRYGHGDWAGVHGVRLMPAGHVAVTAPSYVEGRKIDCLADLCGLRWLLDGKRSEERYWLAENGVDLSYTERGRVTWARHLCALAFGAIEDQLTRATFCQDALQCPAVHIQATRSFRHVAIT